MIEIIFSYLSISHEERPCDTRTRFKYSIFRVCIESLLPLPGPLPKIFWKNTVISLKQNNHANIIIRSGGRK